MRNKKGVTLIFLVVTVIILLMMAGITITSSISLYKKMKYEKFIAQLEELQGAVDKMCEKYNTGEYTSFSDSTTGFFVEIYGEVPGTLAIAENASRAEEVINNYFSGNASYHEGYVFYFNAEQLKDYFNLNGIEFDVVIDFSTRYVYSVIGCSDYEDDNVVYSLIDLKEKNIIQQDETKLESNSSGITFTQVLVQSDTTKMYKINLVLNYSETEGDYNIYKAYYSTDNGTYYFKIQDTSGKVISNIHGSADSVHTTINF